LLSVSVDRYHGDGALSMPVLRTPTYDCDFRDYARSATL